MPDLSDRIKHAKNVAEWKVSQTKRIMDTQGKINDFQKQISRKMQVLSESAYNLHALEKLENDELLKICREIDAIHQAIQRTEAEIETIRNEQSPEILESAKMVLSGLICPKCGKDLAGKFCPEHGVEGVRPAATPVVTANGRKCPKCGKSLVDRFCVDCGVEGVDPEDPQENTTATKKQPKEIDPKKKVSAKSTDTEQIKNSEYNLICPQCGKELDMKFCNYCGVEGVEK
jgi:ssDNA-binding Zn-finger/Zn-ribbon topoisomerase 1